jgi:3-phosphoshikimate 1-carboxyvinyltransferase
METVKEILPFTKPCTGSVVVPGSKSISNRALLLSCFSQNQVTLHGVLKSQDVELMIEALKKVGVKLEVNWDTNVLKVNGCKGIAPIKTGEIEVGNAGTVARFLTAWLAIQENSNYLFDGSDEMRERPIGQLLEFFESGGVDVCYTQKDGFFPFETNTKKFLPHEWTVDATKSSQMLTALMMIAPLQGQTNTILFPHGTVSRPFLNISSEMIKDFSGDNEYSCIIEEEKLNIRAQYKRTKDFVYKVEPDATAASYFLTLPQVVGGSCELNGIWDDMLQGDSGYSKILRALGAEINKGVNGLISNHKSNLEGGEYDFNDISDTFLTLVAVSPLLKSPLVITGIAHTRMQETDRVKAMAQELKKLGQEVIETHDSLRIIPNLNKLKEMAKNSIEIETYQDHRVAMSFGILGSFDLFGTGKSWLKIKNPQCCGKTFPQFFELLEGLRKQSHL